MRLTKLLRRAGSDRHEQYGSVVEVHGGPLFESLFRAHICADRDRQTKALAQQHTILALTESYRELQKRRDHATAAAESQNHTQHTMTPTPRKQRLVIPRSLSLAFHGMYPKSSAMHPKCCAPFASICSCQLSIRSPCESPASGSTFRDFAAWECEIGSKRGFCPKKGL